MAKVSRIQTKSATAAARGLAKRGDGVVCRVNAREGAGACSVYRVHDRSSIGPPSARSWSCPLRSIFYNGHRLYLIQRRSRSCRVWRRMTAARKPSSASDLDPQGPRLHPDPCMHYQHRFGGGRPSAAPGRRGGFEPRSLPPSSPMNNPLIAMSSEGALASWPSGRVAVKA